MAKYRLTAPDGSQHMMTAPDDAQALDLLKLMGFPFSEK